MKRDNEFESGVMAIKLYITTLWTFNFIVNSFCILKNKNKFYYKTIFFHKFSIYEKNTRFNQVFC